jgi:hypothetical protein
VVCWDGFEKAFGPFKRFAIFIHELFNFFCSDCAVAITETMQRGKMRVDPRASYRGNCKRQLPTS